MEVCKVKLLPLHGSERVLVLREVLVVGWLHQEWWEEQLIVLGMKTCVL